MKYYIIKWDKNYINDDCRRYAMKRQKLTPEQYGRANKVLMMALSVLYAMFIIIEFNNVKNTGLGTARIFRIALDMIAILATNIFVRINMQKKVAMVFMSANALVVYIVLVFGNGAGALVMVFPIILVFMIYLNARLIMIGSVSAFIVCIVRSAMFKSMGNIDGFNQSNVIVMGIIICIYSSWRAINLLITFSKEDKLAI